MKNELTLSQSAIENRIFTVRNLQVMLDFHLAELFEVETKRLNEQVKRNNKRFPENFMFQLSKQEWKDMQSQIATAKKETILQSQIATAKRRTIPYVFTEQGVAMLSAVLNSDTAIFVSIQIINAFVKMRLLLSEHYLIDYRLEKVEQKQLETDHKINQIFKAIENKSTTPNQGVFFDGQIFDAYALISDLVRKAKNEIILIDNYVDDSVLTLFTKKGKNVCCAIFSNNISKQLKQDTEKFNKQYGKLSLYKFNKAHDRFLILDRTEVYHIGASLKDLGKKWFAFSKMDKSSVSQLLNSISEML